MPNSSHHNLKSFTSLNVFALTLLVLFSIHFSTFAQRRLSVSGYVREQSSGELLPGVNIYVPSLKSGTITNNYGFYSLTLPPGKYEIHYTYIGFEPFSMNIDLTTNQTVDVNLSGITLREVEISAEKATRVSEDNRMSMITLPVQQIRKIPSLLGEKDVFKALQLMPGVQKGSEGSSGLYVRGGGPDQNLIILDDAAVYNASHLFGFFSIFNGDALKSVELTKGGFPARYGGRLSSVVEMTMKDGNKQKLAGEAGIGLISSRLVLEGPIVKGVSSFIVSGRRTYVDVLTRPLMASDEQVGYYFYDLNAKVNYDFGAKDKIFVSGYFGRDKFNLVSKYGSGNKEEGSLYWQNASSTIRWNHIFGTRVFSNTSLIYSQYNLNINSLLKENNTTHSLEYISGIRDFAAKYDLQYHPTPFYSLRVGLSIINHRFSPSAVVEKNEFTLINTKRKTVYESLESGLYAENNFVIGTKLTTNIGVRLSHFIADNKHYIFPEPRLTLNYKLVENLSLKAGYAEMNQFIHLLSNTGIGLPTDLWVPSTANVSPQNSRQYSAGFAKDIPEYNVTFTLEGYYKASKNILGYKPGASFLILDDPSEAQSFTWEDNVTAGTGKSYGMELLLHKKDGKLSGWIGYTLSWTKLKFDEINFGKEFWARYDRRHDISVVSIYNITPTITFSATWVYGTGNAITLPIGEYHAGAHQPSFDILEQMGSTGQYSFINYNVTDYGDKNSYRMKPYHRIDFAFQFYKKKAKTERTWEVGVYNAYNRKNPFFYFTESIETNNNTQIKKLKQVSLFPVIPSITYTIKF